MTEEYTPATLAEQAEAAQTSATTAKAMVALYISGAPPAEIAERFGYSSVQTCRTAIEKYMGETYGAEDVVASRNKARGRYETLLRATWFDATHPFQVDDDGKRLDARNESHTAALDRARGLIGDLARLDGLNAPTQLQLYDPRADEVMEVIAALRKRELDSLPPEGDIFGEDPEEIVIPAEDDENAG